jgi:hypothetical protein
MHDANKCRLTQWRSLNLMGALTGIYKRPAIYWTETSQTRNEEAEIFPFLNLSHKLPDVRINRTSNARLASLNLNLKCEKYGVHQNTCSEPHMWIYIPEPLPQNTSFQ